MPKLSDVEVNVLSFLQGTKTRGDRAQNIVVALTRQHPYTETQVVDAIWRLSERNRVNVDTSANVHLNS
jgi:hypothetical protein